jgi:hypothetical protein
MGRGDGAAALACRDATEPYATRLDYPDPDPDPDPDASDPVAATPAKPVYPHGDAATQSSRR